MGEEHHVAGNAAEDRRRKPDRRAALERAAPLSTEAIELRGLCDAENRLLTSAQRHIELLRTTTAPDVQRDVAIASLRDVHAELARLHARIGQSLARLSAALPPPRGD